MSPARIPTRTGLAVSTRERGTSRADARARDAARHRPLLGMRRNHRALKNVLKSRQLRHRLELRTTEHLVRSPIGDQLARLQHQHPVAQRVHFLALVRDIENWNGVAIVPAPQIVEDVGSS